MMWNGIIHKYKKFLPITTKTPIITLNEGNTPLIYSNFLSNLISGGTKVYLKYEGLNPTGSFKDRGMTVAVSKALEAGSDAIMCASTGNTSASAACYAARAGIKCIVLLPKGAIALGKLAQALIHGAQVLAIEGNFDDALTLVREITKKYQITLVNSLNPFRIEGQKTGAFEICDQLEDVPDYHFIPVGNAGNITAYWKGYKDYKKAGITNKLPKMMGFQAEGAAPIVRGHIVKNPETIATAIRIGNPASWKQAEQARDESGGIIDMVSDAKILEAYKLLAVEDGVFCEPASAASVAGLIKLVRKGFFKRTTHKSEAKRSLPEGDARERSKAKPPRRGRTTQIVCILTGHGLKDPDRAIKTVKPPQVVKAKLGAVLREIGY